MKTVTRTLLFATLSLSILGTAAFAEPQTELAKILDMFAVREADVYTVHIIADGDISEFSSALEQRESFYKLTLDVPALPPLDTEYEVETPFSRRFQVWPMQLEKKLYSRRAVASAVVDRAHHTGAHHTGATQQLLAQDPEPAPPTAVGALNASHLFVRIQREGAIVASAPEADPVSTTAELITAEPITAEPITAEPITAEPITQEPITQEPDAQQLLAQDPEPAPPTAVAPPTQEPPFSEDSDGGADDSRVTALVPGDNELFLNLFPKPEGDQQTLFNAIPVDEGSGTNVRGIRVGRFALTPSVTASYMAGTNLLFKSKDDVPDDRALLVSWRVGASLLDSLNTLNFTYEGRYRDFKSFQIEKRTTNVLDFNTSIAPSPRSTFAINNHFIAGSFESHEFDPGGEVVGNADSFYRNFTDGTFSMDVSERLGMEISGSFNRVAFLEPTSDYFDYDASSFGGAVLYHLSPLTSIVGEYASIRTRPDLTRPEAASDGNVLLVGLRGEITALIRGRIRAGFLSQTLTAGATPQSFRGFVADARLSREFGRETSLVLDFGRRTNPSAFQENGFYTSNYGSARFVAPIAEKLRFSISTSYFANRYPLSDIVTDSARLDRTLSSAVGISFFFTQLSYFSVDYRRDKRHSSLDRFDYLNNAVQFMLGFGFLNR